MSALRQLGLAPGDPITVDMVPWEGVRLAISENPRKDGRAWVADRVATGHGQPHDLVLIAVPPGKGLAIIRRLAAGEELVPRG